MAAIPDHPNDDGSWARLEGREGFALWRRQRVTFAPITMFYVVAPPRQSEILYDEEKARARYEQLIEQAEAADAARRAAAATSDKL
nr:hypothetical protein [uncultured Brevundimonas sp.]